MMPDCCPLVSPAEATGDESQGYLMEASCFAKLGISSRNQLEGLSHGNARHYRSSRSTETSEPDD
jgi:hypothetical protein